MNDYLHKVWENIALKESIQFADCKASGFVREMWKTCFGDADEYINLHFLRKYKEENTLLYFVGDTIVASLQMLPYSFSFYGQFLPVSYLAGICTLPNYRHRGYASKLITEAHRILAQRQISIAILIPAEKRLYDFYNKHDYEQVFEKEDIEIPLSQIIEKSTNIKEAYTCFNLIYGNKDFCIQKSLTDFETIVEEYKIDKLSVKTNLEGMACVINSKTLLDLYAINNKHKSFTLKITHCSSQNNIIYYINKGSVKQINNADIKTDLEITNREFCRLLFGYKTKKMRTLYRNLFPEHKTTLNLMLE